MNISLDLLFVPELRLAYVCKNITTNPYVIKKIPIFADKELLSTIECKQVAHIQLRPFLPLAGRLNSCKISLFATSTSSSDIVAR